MEAIYWTTSALALIGVLLNIRKNRICFLIWAITNAVWAVVDFKKKIHAQAALQLVYFFLSAYGFASWAMQERPGKLPDKKPEE